LDYLVRFDGGELFRNHILPTLEQQDVDVSVFLDLRTVSKAWVSLFYAMSRICLGPLVSDEKQKKHGPSAMNEVLLHSNLHFYFRAIRHLKVLPGHGIADWDHEVFARLHKLTLTLVDYPQDRWKSFFDLTCLPERLTSLSLGASLYLVDENLSRLVNLRSLQLLGECPRLIGHFFKSLTKLEKLSLLCVPSISYARYCGGFDFAKLKTFRCNSYHLLDSLQYNGTCRFYDSCGKKLLYIGPYENGLMHGTGVYYLKAGRYEGQFERGEFSGQGTYYFDDGNKYVGAWRKSMREGKGTQYYRNYGYYIGDWLNGQRHGYGVETDGEGGRYEGEWVDGNRQGVGIYYLPSDGIYEGQWLNSKRHGWGVYWWRDGMRFEGDWIEDKREGPGELFYSDHHDCDKRVGQWKNDILVSFKHTFGRQANYFIHFFFGAFTFLCFNSIYKSMRW
jgi:hypothetical protein